MGGREGWGVGRSPARVRGCVFELVRACEGEHVHKHAR